MHLKTVSSICGSSISSKLQSELDRRTFVNFCRPRITFNTPLCATMYVVKHLVTLTVLACFLATNPSHGSPVESESTVGPESAEKTTIAGPTDGILFAVDEDEEERHSFPREPEADVVFNENDYVEKPVDITQFPDLHVNNSRIYGRASCRCGIPPPGKIVGGIAGKIVDIPWTVGIVRSSFFVGPFPGQRPSCGGTVINNLYVVTAGHCVDGKHPKSILVWLKAEDINNATSRSVVNISSIIMHPEYSRKTVDNDIALLKLATPVDFDPVKSILAPACIPANNDNDFNAYNAVAAGWGAISGTGPQSTYLRKVTVPVMTNEKCNRDTQYTNRISPNMLCAGFLEGGKDACQGDSGGPLTIHGERDTLIGVVSWGYGCAKPRAPGVYTRVGRYPQWILENSDGADWCAE